MYDVCHIISYNHVPFDWHRRYPTLSERAYFSACRNRQETALTQVNFATVTVTIRIRRTGSWTRWKLIAYRICCIAFFVPDWASSDLASFMLSYTDLFLPLAATIECSISTKVIIWDVRNSKTFSDSSHEAKMTTYIFYKMRRKSAELMWTLLTE